MNKPIGAESIPGNLQEQTPVSVLAMRGLEGLVRSGSFRVYHRIQEKDSTKSGFTEIVFDPQLRGTDVFPDFAQYVLLNIPVPTSWSVSAEIVGGTLSLEFIRLGSGQQIPND